MTGKTMHIRLYSESNRRLCKLGSLKLRQPILSPLPSFIMLAIRRLLIGFLALSAPSALALQRRCEPGESCQTIIPSVVTQT